MDCPCNSLHFARKSTIFFVMNIYGEPILPFNIISCITDLIGYNKLIIVIWDLSSLHQ